MKVVDLGTVAIAAALLVAQSVTMPPRFEAIQPDLLSTGGTLVNAAADYDGDGDADLFVGFNGVANRLYRNDRGVLVDVAAALGVADARATRAAAWVDFDADGDSDLLIGFAPGPGAGSVLRLYRNDRARGAAGRRATRPTGQSGRASRTWTVTAASICSPPITDRTACS